MTIEETIAKHKIDLLMERPFFGSVLSQIHVFTDNSIPTACTDGRVIKINPKFWESLQPAEQLGLLAHEVLHVALAHHVRMQSREPFRWNIATDAAINPLLLEAGFSIPEGGIVDDHTPPRHAEILYDLLPQSQTSPQWGEVSEAPGNVDPEEEEQRILTILSNAYRQAAGTLPLGLDRLIRDMLAPPQLPWDALLEQYVAKSVPTEYSYRKFARRYLNRGLYLPALSEPKLDLVLALDTSGSVADEDLAVFMGIINNIRSMYPTQIRVLYCDTSVYVGEEIGPHDDLALKPKGGGGTDYKPVFEWVNQQEEAPDCLIYLTDGQCDSYPEPGGFDYPAIFVIFESLQQVSIKTL